MFAVDWFHLSIVCDTVVGAGSEEMLAWLLLLLRGLSLLIPRGLGLLAFPPRVLPGRAGPVPLSSGAGPSSLWTGASCSSTVAVEDPPDMMTYGARSEPLDVKKDGQWLV